MYREAGRDIRIFCDYGSRILRVATNAFASVPNLKAQWEEVASFGNQEEWCASAFAHQVTCDATKEDICWFWIDMNHSITT